MPRSTSTTRTDVTVTARTVVVGEHHRDYVVVAPPAPSDPAAAPALVLVFHGSNQDAEVLRRNTGAAFDALASREAGGGVVVAYLNGYRRQWNDARSSTNFPTRRKGYDDVAFSQAVIDTLIAERSVDPARVYAVGFSAGGQMVIRLLHQVPHLLAGAALISATQPVPEAFLLATEPATPMPVVLIHGTEDRLVPYEGGMSSLWGFRKRGEGLSAPATAEYYARRNGITTEAVDHRLPHLSPADRTTATRRDFRQDGRPPVTLYTVVNGGHTVPGPKNFPRILGRTGHDLVAADAIAEFFGLPALDRTRSPEGSA